MAELKKYKLDDGQEVTVQDVLNRMPMPRSTAAYRLCTSTDPKVIFRKPIKGGNHKPLKKWTLDDGSVWTSDDVSEKLGCSRSGALRRLSRSTDPARVFAPLHTKDELSDSLEKIIGDRMYFDGRDQWKLIMKNT